VVESNKEIGFVLADSGVFQTVPDTENLSFSTSPGDPIYVQAYHPLTSFSLRYSGTFARSLVCRQSQSFYCLISAGC